MILSWQENLAKDELPPEWMWTLDDELEQWFQGVEEERKARFSGASRTREPLTEVPMMENALARDRKRR